MAQQTRRETRLDALKGLAMLAVVLGHAIAAPHVHASYAAGRLPFLNGYLDAAAVFNPLYNVIQSVNLPLFAFISGLLLGRRPGGSGTALVRRRFMTLMVPYLAWTVLELVRVLATQSAAAAAKGLAVALVNPELGAGYFLYTLFECYLVYAIAKSVTSRDWLLVTATVVIAATVLLPLPNVLGIRDLAFILPFFVMGVLAATRTFWEKWPAIAASAAVYVAALVLTWPTTVGGDRFWFASVRGALVSVGLHSKITNVWMVSAAYHSMRYLCGAAGIVLLFAAYTRAAAWFLAPQAWVGRRSLGIYMSHVPILAALFAFGVTSTIPLFLLTTAAAIAITLVLEQVPWVRGFFLGMWPRPPALAAPDGGGSA